MKARVLVGVMCSVACFAAQAGKPSEAVINACLKTQNVQEASFVELDTTEQVVEEDEGRQLKATYFRDHGIRFGYVDRKGKASLVWKKDVIALSKAVALDADAATPAPFSPALAVWGRVKEKHKEFLCVNFNFDGLGMSGTFQQAHGIYLLNMAAKEGKKRLHFGIRRE